jgi:hypothetical protein
MTPATEPPSQPAEFVVGRRQAAAVAFLAITLVGLCATIAYLAGRLSGVDYLQQANAQQPNSATRSRAAAPAGVPLPKPSPLVDPTEAAAALSEVPIADPPPGRYLQVAATDRQSVARVVKELETKAVKALVAPGPSAETARILVGPVDQGDAENQLRLAIEPLGYRPFPKVF